MRLGLTKRQSEVLHFLREYIQQHGFPPTIQEIQQHFGFSSSNAASSVLRALERKGYIVRIRKHCARSIQLVDEDSPSSVRQPASGRQIMIIGDGSADNPLSVFLNPRGQIVIDPAFYSSDQPLFAAIVPDNALARDGIAAGDLVVAEQTTLFSHRSLVIGLLHTTLFVRRYLVQSDDHIELRASMKGFPPIKFTTGDPHIALLGRVIGIMKRL